MTLILFFIKISTTFVPTGPIENKFPNGNEDIRNNFNSNHKKHERPLSLQQIFLVFNFWHDCTQSQTVLTPPGLVLSTWSPHGVITETGGFVTHVYVTRELGAVLHDTYMWHQAKMR